MCGVGKFLHCWKERDNLNCPWCGFFEDAPHAWTCKQKESNVMWDKFLLSLLQWLEEMQTDPDLTSTLGGMRVGHFTTGAIFFHMLSQNRWVLGDSLAQEILGSCMGSMGGSYGLIHEGNSPYTIKILMLSGDVYIRALLTRWLGKTFIFLNRSYLVSWQKISHIRNSGSYWWKQQLKILEREDGCSANSILSGSNKEYTL